MDDHLYTLRVAPDGGYTSVYRGPHRAALAGGALPSGAEGERLWESLVHPDDRELWCTSVARLVHAEPIELEYRLVGLDGTERIVLDRLRPRRGPDGTLFYDGATRDITERRQLEDELRLARGAAELRARTDELTGAYNRRHFAEIVAEALGSDADDCGLLLLDADHFKQVNDMHGHGAGDAVLVELARRLTAELGPDDCLARWGGEEFAVLLRRVASGAELEDRAERLRAAVAVRPVVAADVSVRLTISIGAARAGAELGTLDALVEEADRCLYTAKRLRSQSRVAARGQRGRSTAGRARGGGHGARARAHVRVGRRRARAPRRARRRPRRADRGAHGTVGRRWGCAAGSPAGSTMSARSRSPSGSWPSPARSTPTSGR